MDRVSDVLTRPTRAFWQGIAEESCSNSRVVFAYLLPLLLAAWGFRSVYVAQIVGWGPSLILVADTVIAVVVLSAFLGVVSDFMAPRFGGERRGPAAFKLFAFLQTPVLVAMILEFIFSLAGAPQLSGIFEFAGYIYGIYLLWIGLPAFFGLGPKSNFIAFPMVIAMLWFILRFFIALGAAVAYQTWYGESPLEDTLEAGYTLRSFSKDDMPQGKKKSHRISLSAGTDYRFVFLAQHRLSNIDFRITDATGSTLASDDPTDQDGTVFLDFNPEVGGTYYMVTEIGNLGGPSLRTKTELYTFMKATEPTAEQP